MLKDEFTGKGKEISLLPSCVKEGYRNRAKRKPEKKNWVVDTTLIEIGRLM